MRYQRKPVPVEAYQFTGENFGLIELALGEYSDNVRKGLVLEPSRHNPSGKYFHAITVDGVKKVHIGDWVVWSFASDLFVFSDEDFRKGFEPLSCFEELGVV